MTVGVFLNHSLPYPFRQGLSLDLKVIDSVLLASRSSDAPVSATAAVELQGCDTAPGILLGAEI